MVAKQQSKSTSGNSGFSAASAEVHGYGICFNHRQTGVALITVLLMLVFLSILAIYRAENQDIDIRKVSNLRESERAFQIGMGGEQWAVKLLEKDMFSDAQTADGDQDHLGESWANLGPAVKVEGTESYMQVTLIDQQGKFNINNLIQGKPRPVPPSDNNEIEDGDSASPEQGKFRI